MSNRVRSYLPFLLFGFCAYVAYLVGSTLGVFLTVFAIMVWAIVGLTFVYMILFRNMKFTLFADDPEPQVADAVIYEAPAEPVPADPAPAVPVPADPAPAAPVRADSAPTETGRSVMVVETGKGDAS